MLQRILFFCILLIGVKSVLKSQRVPPPPPPPESESERMKRAVTPIKTDLPPNSIPQYVLDKNTGEPDPTRFIPGAKQPKVINMDEVQKAIGYPEEAINIDFVGSITFRVLIDEYGNYVRHLPAKVGTPVLIKAIEAHINKLKFTPAVYNGTNVKFWVNVPFTFERPTVEKEIKKE